MAIVPFGTTPEAEKKKKQDKAKKKATPNKGVPPAPMATKKPTPKPMPKVTPKAKPTPPSMVGSAKPKPKYTQLPRKTR